MVGWLILAVEIVLVNYDLIYLLLVKQTLKVNPSLIQAYE